MKTLSLLALLVSIFTLPSSVDVYANNTGDGVPPGEHRECEYWLQLAKEAGGSSTSSSTPTRSGGSSSSPTSSSGSHGRLFGGGGSSGSSSSSSYPSYGSDEWKAKEKERKDREAKELIALFTDFMNDHPKAYPAFKDLVRAKQLKKGIRETKAVALAFGNPKTKLNKKQLKQIEKTLDHLAGIERTFIYDADSALAPLIAKKLGKKAFGITGNPKLESKSVFVIENPYARLQAWKESDIRLGTNDSLVALGLHTETGQDGLHFVIDLDGKGFLDLHHWERKLVSSNLDLGVPFYKEPTMDTHFDRYINSPYSQEKPEHIFALYNNWKAGLSKYEVEEIAKQAKGWAKYSVSPDSSAQLVLFGSSKEKEPWASLVYNTARWFAERALGIATGGSSGLMYAANQASFDAGAVSVGIPMDNGFSLKEEKTSTNVHTSTVGAAGYPVRIPLLLHNRQAVLIGPGGKGTMQEIATLYLGMAAGGYQIPIFFIGDEYYASWVKWLQSSALAPHFFGGIQHIRALSDLEELLEVFKALGITFGETPKPRNTRTSFEPEPKPIYTPSSSGGGGFGGGWGDDFDGWDGG